MTVTPDPADPTPVDADGAAAKRGKGEGKKRSALREGAILVGIAVFIYYVMLTFIARPYLIPSESMQPTLNGCKGCVGDRIMVDKLTYRFSDPEPGDVVVFKYPLDTRVDYIKRVVGVPGDQVAYLNKSLTINGQAISKATLPDFFEEDVMRYFKQFEEKLGNKPHRLLNDADREILVGHFLDLLIEQHVAATGLGRAD